MSTVEQPHLVSLVLQSKKALQHGEQLCHGANDLSNATAQCAMDIFALDAKIKWITDAVVEQLKLAASVAKSIEERRLRLSKEVQEWDQSRIKRANALDNVLESLGSQRVPPELYEMSRGSSIFGSQHSDEEKPPSPQRSPSATVRIPNKLLADRTTWKTLRDFVDDRAIDEIMDTLEDERTVLDDILGKTDEFPEVLRSTITSIRNLLPDEVPPTAIESHLNSQDEIIHSMAALLVSLTGHYDQMAGALRDSEAGEAFSDGDLQEMHRDTEELPAIMADLEHYIASVKAVYDTFVSFKSSSQAQLDSLHDILDDLDELGNIMTEMLETQDSVEVECEEKLSELHQQLFTIENLHERFVLYRTAFGKLVLEIERRRVYSEAAENIVRGMNAQLEAMTDEERLVREHFNAEHGAHLPEDICLFIGNPPTQWEVVPRDGEITEVVPEIERDFLKSLNIS
ncbi:autophagy-related protein 17 [Desarmillaria ectypa]|nr:autophagy-related protein 17 [Desarmillaria ectypa]